MPDCTSPPITPTPLHARVIAAQQQEERINRLLHQVLRLVREQQVELRALAAELQKDSQVAG